MSFFHNRYREYKKDFEPVIPEKKYLRVNTLKITEEELIAKLTQRGVTLTKEHFPHSYSYEAEFSLSSTIEHLIGYFYLQGLASQAVAHALQPQEDWTILDMAAAPGSKTTHIAQFMNNTGKIIALDQNAERLVALRNNCERLGVTNVVSIRKDAKYAPTLKLKADAVLLDAPCSGNYCSEKDWEKKRQLPDIKKNARVQKELLKAAMACLNPGGVLIYSTCSLEPEEDEEVVLYGLKRGLILEPIPQLADFGSSGIPLGDSNTNSLLKHTKRFWPQETQTEGFFIARMRKPK